MKEYLGPMGIIISSILAIIMVGWAGYELGRDSLKGNVSTQQKAIEELRDELNASVPQARYSSLLAEYNELSNDYNELYDAAEQALASSLSQRYTPPQSFNCTTNTIGATTFTNCY